jgi:dimethylglycine dehydrogenase
MVGLTVAGPRSRDVLQKLTDTSLATKDFPFMSFRRVNIGMAPVWLSRMTYTGDLGYEIWIAPEYQRYLFDLIWDAGKEFDMRLFGFRALITMRLEKNFGTWYREFRPIYTPLESGMERAMKFDHEFIGRAAVEAEMKTGPARKLVMFKVDVDKDKPADVLGDEPVFHNGEVVGWITSGGYAHYSGVSLALGYIPAALAAEGTTGFEIEIIGNMRPAHLQLEPVLDPSGSRMRA